MKRKRSAEYRVSPRSPARQFRGEEIVRFGIVAFTSCITAVIRIRGNERRFFVRQSFGAVTEMADSFKSAQGSSKSVQRIKVTKTIQKTLPNVRLIGLARYITFVNRRLI